MMILDVYETGGFFDEMLDDTGAPRTGMKNIVEKLVSISQEELVRRQRSAERTLRELGITFTLKTEDGNTERIFPFDLIRGSSPRMSGSGRAWPEAASTP